ncbi:M20/M25/M40 family metallo-hydrolase, partial [Chromohalobacter beijerinckii]
LQEYGLKNIHIDKTGNVIGTRPGTGSGPNLVLSAHLDIAFEKGVDTTVTKKNNKLYAPGISDDNRGLAAILSVARGLEDANLQTVGDIIFVGTVGEENTFRGVRALFKERNDIDGFITVDGTSAKSIGYGSTAGYTISFKFHGPGGHSWGNYERPSAIHAMGRAIDKISEWGNKDPKTAFNVGIVKGGTAENAKAVNASMLMEFRTDGENEESLKKKLLQAVDNAVDQENSHWGADTQNVTVDHKIKVKIPGGRLAKSSMMVQAATASTDAVGEQPVFIDSGMTDANYSFGAGIPGINLGGGGDSDNAHSLDEWYDPIDAYLGPQKIFLTALGLVGVDGVSDPLLTNNRSSSTENDN